MTDNNQEGETGTLRETPVVFSEETTTVNFERPDELVGQILDGRFRIEKNLTEGGADVGGIGVVYLARDMNLMSRETVVKILKKEALQSEDIARKFQHEKEALIRLNHPNIVQILDSGNLLDGNPFMVMEYLGGLSLSRVLQKEGKLSFDLASHIIESVTDALSAAHSKKILHRDIKPANIMLTPQEAGPHRVRLIDFGIARVEESQLAPVTINSQGYMGTVLYSAPEQLRTNVTQTPALDIYSFGIVAYEMLTGELPFKARSLVEMYKMQEAGVQTPPRSLREDLPQEAEKILLSALEFEPEKRPQNARIFGRDLARALKKDPAEKKTDEIPAPLPTPLVTKRGFQIASLVLLVLVAFTIVAVIAIWNAGPLANNTDSNMGTNGGIGFTGARRKLTYFLTVQKMRDGQPFEEPFTSSGQEIFENGYKFKMTFQSDDDGFMYIFNEDKQAGQNVYNILYPTPKMKNGSGISGRRQIETGNNTFSGGRGTEIIWLIWTKQEHNLLENLREAAFANSGRLRFAEDTQTLKDFLEKHQSEMPLPSKGSETQQTIITGYGDIIVRRIELEHR